MPEPQRPLKVFLSYASQDKPTVRELSRRLVGEGWIDTWQDEKSLLPGQDWRVKIEEAVEEADVVIICLSNQSVSKEGHVQKELRYAREIALEKPEDAIFLIPLRLDECEVPRGLRFYQWVDYFGGKKDSSYKALVASLKLRYEQKLRVEKEERLRKEKQEREAAEQAAREKAEKGVVEELKKQNANIGKAEHKVNERNEQGLQEKELRERPALEAREKEKHEFEKKEKKPVAAKPQATGQTVYWFAGFIVLLLGIVLLSIWNKPLSVEQPTSENTQTQTIASLTQNTVEPSATTTPKLTSTLSNTDTPTPLPTEITDAKGVSMVLVPAGEFTMGVDSVTACQNYSGYLNCEKTYQENFPVTVVALDSFYIDKKEVTNESYEECVNNQGCKLPVETKLGSIDYYGNDKYNDYPVVLVSREMAKLYCKWRGARLPSSAEWEKTARGLDERPYPWGYETDVTLRANGPGAIDGYQTTSPVGSFPLGVSPYGALDMAGNVNEIVSDNVTYFYTSKTYTYPMTRGGSWCGITCDGWKTVRLLIYGFGATLGESTVDNWETDVGFRCAKSVTEDSPATPVQTEIPTASETPANGFEIIALPTVVYRGGDATVTVRTQPRSACELGFILPSGQPSTAGGLGPRTADDEGICSWTWTIAHGTDPGQGYATIIAGGTSERYMIEIK